MYISRWPDVQRTGLLAALGAGRDTVLDAVRGNRLGIEDNLHDMFAYRKTELAFVGVPGQRAPAAVPQLVLHHDRLAAGEHPVEQQLADEQPRLALDHDRADPALPHRPHVGQRVVRRGVPEEQYPSVLPALLAAPHPPGPG